ncbi:NAD(P)-binding protein [Atractiella rhizophila]|nr:NAD(P)-binding protein [Atractiella rhizophila]
MPKQSLFLIGTGFIGGTLLTRLLETHREKFDFFALTRRDEQATVLKGLGVTPIKGSLADFDVIKEQTIKSDVIIHTATADDLPSAPAILSGIASRSDLSKPVVYIHTSGTGVLCNMDNGEESTYIHDDSVPSAMDERLTTENIHREIDLEIKRFVDEKKGGSGARIQIVLPPLIYGKGEGPFNQRSIQIPILTELAVKEGYSGYWGKGEAYWNNISIQALVDGYLLILTNLVSSTPDLSSLYYFAETGEHRWRDIAEAIGMALQTRGKVEEGRAKSFGSDVFGGNRYLIIQFGGNSRGRATRLRKLGWHGKSERDVVDNVEWEMDGIFERERFVKKIYDDADESKVLKMSSLYQMHCSIRAYVQSGKNPFISPRKERPSLLRHR